MLTLSLLRHAKSSWGDATLADFDRPLNNRGRDAAPRMGALMRREGLRPDHILCSPSVRTRQTLDLIQPTIAPLVVAVFLDALYHGAPITLLRAIHEAPDTARHVLLVGHNPGLQELAIWLTGSGAEAKRRALDEKFPTAALVVLTFEVSRWAEISPGGGRLRLFAKPRDLDA